MFNSLQKIHETSVANVERFAPAAKSKFTVDYVEDFVLGRVGMAAMRPGSGSAPAAFPLPDSEFLLVLTVTYFICVSCLFIRLTLSKSSRSRMMDFDNDL